MGVQLPPGALNIITKLNMVTKLAKLVLDSINSKGVSAELGDILVEVPGDPKKGDYTTNIAMRLASKSGKNPVELAREIVSGIVTDDSIEKIEVVAPGFINFFLSSRYLLTELSKIVEQEDEYFKFDSKVGKNIVIEYTDPNPFKVLHVGHLYTNIVGESFARLQESLGANVKRANYQGDVGLHVAKTLWGLERKMLLEGVTFEEIEGYSLEDRVRYLGDSYIYGSQQYDVESDKKVQEEIDSINYYIYSKNIPSLPSKESSEYEEKKYLEKYTKGRQWCLDYFETIYKRLGTKFDYYFFESEVGEAGLKLVLDNVGEIFKQDGQAIIYEGKEDLGLHTRVFVNSHGLPTYEAKELALAIKKGGLIKYDESVVITGSEQAPYFKVVFDVLSKIDPVLSERSKHIPHGIIQTPDGKKMGSRKGGFANAEYLLGDVQSRVEELMEASNRVDDLDVEDVSEKISIAAIKYAFLKVSVGKNIIFDMEKSVAFDGDTGPYLLYVYSRCRSILDSVESVGSSNLCLDLCLDNPHTKELVRAIGRGRYLMLASAEGYSPSILCSYLFTLGQVFNNFYQNVRVLDAGEEEREILLLLLKAVMTTMRVGLDRLGINTVEKM